LAVGFWLLAFGFWLLAVGCWLLALAVGCWLLAVGCWLLAFGCWLLVVGAVCKAAIVYRGSSRHYCRFRSGRRWEISQGLHFISTIRNDTLVLDNEGRRIGTDYKTAKTATVHSSLFTIHSSPFTAKAIPGFWIQIP
jgi:hypothetical protein